MLTALAVLLGDRSERATLAQPCLASSYTSGMQFNRLMFWLFYRVGTPPWEGHPLPERLRELIEGPSALPPGKALMSDAGRATRRSISLGGAGM